VDAAIVAVDLDARIFAVTVVAVAVDAVAVVVANQ